MQDGLVGEEYKFMKRLLCLFVLALPLMAATETATITVPDALGVELAAALDPWIQAQRNANGSIKYPGATVAARRAALLQGILIDGVRSCLLRACGQFPPTCSINLKAAIEGKAAADSDITTELSTIIQ